MDSRDRAEAAIAQRVRTAIERRGRMPAGSLEYNGADIESFSAAVLVAMVSCSDPDDLVIALQAAREEHIIKPLVRVAVTCEADDLEAEFDGADSETRVGRNYIAGVGYLNRAGPHLSNLALTRTWVRPEFGEDEFVTIDARDSIVGGSCRSVQLAPDLLRPSQSWEWRDQA